MAWVEWSPVGGATGSMVRALLNAVFGLHSTFQDEIWLWRGEARASYGLEPGMHTRVRGSGASDPEAMSRLATMHLLEKARHLSLDRLDGVSLPDLALLAHLQHHGAATPLLDVSVDPMVALWMVANASGDNLNDADDESGRLIAMKRPPPARWLTSFDARPYWSASEPSVASEMAGKDLFWYRPPEVSERLRIQRGSFLLGRFAPGSDLTTLPLQIDPSPGREQWLATRISNLGSRGRPAAPRPFSSESLHR